MNSPTLLHRQKARWEAFRESERGRAVVRAVRGAFLAGVVGYLVYEFSRIGWRAVWTSLPAEPLFYVLLVAMYALLPIAEAVIYGRLWGLRLRDCMAASFRKRVLNQDVLGYSGEVYLYVWAKDRIAVPARRVMATIKDNLVVSSIASVATACLLVGGLLFTGLVRLSDFVPRADLVLVGGGVVVLALVASAVVRFRRTIFTASGGTVGFMLGVHGARFLVGWMLQLLQWWIVVPEVAFDRWIILLGVMVLTNRIPFMPSSDLVFVGIGARVAGVLEVPVAEVAAMLLVRSVFEKALNVGLFTLTSLRDREPVPAEAA